MEAVQRPALLSALADLISRAPPSISAIINALEHSENEYWFQNMVREVLGPGAEPIIAMSDPDERGIAFCEHINHNYFPLHPFDGPFGIDVLLELDEPVSSWLRYGVIPQVRGVGYEDLHDLWTHYSPPFASLGLLCTPEHLFESDLGDIHVSWLESAKEHIPEETLRKLPARPPEIDRLRRILDGTGHEDVAVAAASLWGDTGNLFIDYSLQDAFETGLSFSWTREVVEDLAGEWSEAQSHIQATDRACEWLKEDLQANIKTIIDLIAQAHERSKP